LLYNKDFCQRLMKQFLWFVLSMIPQMFLPVFSQSRNSCDIYLITCGPGTEIETIYGHSAIRMVYVSNGTDSVFNWGVYDFRAPNFIWLNPFLIFGWISLFTRNKRPVWFWIILLISILFLIFWKVLPQSLNTAFIPLILILIARASIRIFKSYYF
jgi:hypothetical protein